MEGEARPVRTVLNADWTESIVLDMRCADFSAVSFWVSSLRGRRRERRDVKMRASWCDVVRRGERKDVRREGQERGGRKAGDWRVCMFGTCACGMKGLEAGGSSSKRAR